MTRSNPFLLALATAVVIACCGLTVWYVLAEDDEAVLAIDADGAGALSFFALGDHGKTTDAQQDVADAMERVAAATRDVAFTIFLGDNFYQDGVASIDDELWEDVFEERYDGKHLLGMPFFAILGNHDVEGSVEAQIAYARERRGSARWRMDGRHYERLFGRTADGRGLLQVIFLDSNVPEDPDQQTFLAEAVSDRRALWRVIAAHHPLHSFGPHEPDEAVIAAFMAAARTADLFLCGHDHNVQVASLPDGPLHVVSGGGGRSLDPIDRPVDDTLLFAPDDYGFVRVTVDEQRLVVHVHDRDGEHVFEASREPAAWPVLEAVGK